MSRGRGPALLVVLAVVSACNHLDPYRDPRVAVPTDVPATPPIYRLLLIGDAGEATEMTLAALRGWVDDMPDRTLVVFLGDNAYPEGLTEARRDDAQRRLERQVQVVEDTPAEAIFIPGNHDWADGGPDGLTALRAQEAFLRGRARFLPANGCPGPALVDVPAVEPRVRVVALDTQWWLHDWSRPTDGCTPGTEAQVVEVLRAALETDLPVVVAAHHPLATHGPHGGFFDWRAHLFPLTALARWLWVPLPGVGSLYPLSRRAAPPDQDLRADENREMRDALAAAFLDGAGRGPLLYAAGHEHSLQVLRSDIVDYVLVSGAGSRAKITPVASGPDTVFAHEHAGFMALDVAPEAIRLSVVEPVADGSSDVVFRFSVSLP